jgi:hypothetical protein
VFPVRYDLNSYINCILPTECICVPYGSHNKQRLFPLNSINRLGFVAETLCVSCEVRTEFLYILHSSHRVYPCVLYGSHN